MKSFLVYGLTNDWGGVEAIVMGMIQRLSRESKFDVILSPVPSSYEKKFKGENVSFIHIPTWGGDRKGFAESLKNIYKNNHYDYLWINGCLMSNKTIVKVTKEYSDAKIIAHSHGSSFEENNIIKKNILLFLHNLNRAYYHKNVEYPCMCSYKSGMWFYGEKYMKANNVHYVKNGIDVERFRFQQSIRGEYRNALQLKDDELALFHVGRLTEVKNQKMILDVFKELASTGFKAKLFIAGEGELRNDLETQAKQLGIFNLVTFLGARSDVDKLYQAMDVLLLPSFHEGFPLTLVEAQSSGLYCLVSDAVSNETNIVDLVQFLPITTGSISSWVNAIVKLSSTLKYERSHYADLMIEAGFDMSKVCDNFLNFIK